MILDSLSILDATGDRKVYWDPAKPEDVARAREEVATLKEAGYRFFLIDGTPADEITAAGAQGELVAKIITPDEVVEEVPAGKRRPGRPRKIVAARPVAGGGN